MSIKIDIRNRTGLWARKSVRNILRAGGILCVGAVLGGGLGSGLGSGLGRELAHAATDGEIGASSEGSVNLSVVIPALVRISNLEDVEFGSWNGTQNLSKSDNVCVWSSSRGYSLTGAGGDGAFTLVDDSGNELPYAVAWQTPDGDQQVLTAGQVQQDLATAAQDPACSNADSMAVMTIDIAQEDLAAAPAGAYAGVLTLTVGSE